MSLLDALWMEAMPQPFKIILYSCSIVFGCIQIALKYQQYREKKLENDEKEFDFNKKKNRSK
jgi:hypothetical protein